MKVSIPVWQTQSWQDQEDKLDSACRYYGYDSCFGDCVKEAIER